MNTADLCEEILRLLGGRENIIDSRNCMTRLRVTLVNLEKADVPSLMALQDVMGVNKENPIQIILGPGKAQKVGQEFAVSLKEGYVKPIPLSVEKSWEDNKAAHATHHRGNPVKDLLAKLSGIFTPMIPAIIAAGLCSGFGGLLGKMAGTGGFLFSLSQLLTLIGNTFFYGFTVFTGIYTAKAFGASPTLGGLLGAVSLTPASCSIPGAGGGILGVILGVYILSLLEKWLRKHLPDHLTLLITPFVSIFISVSLYIYLIMPATGWLTEMIIKGVSFLTASPSLPVRLILGFILGASFLPIVMGGYHHIFVILYALELQQLGEISLLPCFIMAGAGQVGACFAIYLKAKRTKNVRMAELIQKALPAALLGVGEPLIYGVTLPLKEPFLTAGMGAGFGGAVCMGAGVRMCAWGISGLAAIPLMMSFSMMLWFLFALLISYTMAFAITTVLIRKETIKNG